MVFASFATFASVGLFALVTACHTVPDPPQVARSTMAAPPAESSQIARGRYIATVSGCTTCHTARLAGGHEERLGNGATWCAPNITMDRETGIGAWTDAQIIAAIRDGQRPDGSAILGLHPAAYYRQMTDEDANAVVAYMRSMPAVGNRIDPIVGIHAMHVAFMAPPGASSGRGSRGEYLATLMHCGACHTPSTGPHAGAPLAGGVGFEFAHHGLVSPNITPDPATGTGTWRDADLIGVVTTMTTPDGAPITGPMTRYRRAWSQLMPADAAELAKYIKSVPAVNHEITERLDVATRR